jgi:hypothetical protein
MDSTGGRAARHHEERLGGGCAEPHHVDLVAPTALAAVETSADDGKTWSVALMDVRPHVRGR